MSAHLNGASQPAPAHDSSAAPSPTAGRVLFQEMPVIQRQILMQLAGKATDAHRYAALQIDGYDVAAIDDAIEVLHDAGLLNAFFVDRAARPRFHPSSLTREGRRICDEYLRAACQTARWETCNMEQP